MKRQSLVVFQFAAFASIANVSPVFAHVALDHAIPAVGSTMQKSPTKVTLWFTEEVEAAFSSIHVFDDSGHEVDKGDVAVNLGDKRVLAVATPPLP